MDPDACPVESLDEIEGEPERVPQLFGMRLRQAISRRLAPGWKRKLKQFRNRLLRRGPARRGSDQATSTGDASAGRPGLQAGDLVRVRSKEEIEASLDRRRRLHGLRFMPEMAPYCATTQRVFKRLDRFFDESKLTVKCTSGVVLLDGLLCPGVEKVGRCDRSCFFFWREEWLERIDDTTAPR